jgi:hypothetical protein
VDKLMLEALRSEREALRHRPEPGEAVDVDQRTPLEVSPPLSVPSLPACHFLHGCLSPIQTELPQCSSPSRATQW